MKDNITSALIIGSFIGLPILYGEIKENSESSCNQIESEIEIIGGQAGDSNMTKHVKIMKLSQDGPESEPKSEHKVFVFKGDPADAPAWVEKAMTVEIENIESSGPAPEITEQ
jgi:hypothetical protein